jgi:hypothetical protein
MDFLWIEISLSYVALLLQKEIGKGFTRGINVIIVFLEKVKSKIENCGRSTTRIKCGLQRKLNGFQTRSKLHFSKTV